MALQTKKNPPYIILTIAVFSLVLFVCLAELTLRIINPDLGYNNRFFTVNRDLDYPDVTLRDSELFWKLHPNETMVSNFFDNDTIHTNGLGLRGNDIPAKSQKTRIVALGNSCTFGWSVDFDSIFTTRLKSILGDRFEVINAGVPGYSSYQGRVFLDREYDKLNPDILLIMFGWNDHWPAAVGISDKEQRFPPQFVVSLQNLLSKLRTYRLIRKLLLSVIEGNSGYKEIGTNMKYRVGYTDFEMNLREICKTAEAIGALPILMTSPIASESSEQSESTTSSLRMVHANYNDIMRNLAKTDSINIIDVYEAFSKESGLFDKPGYDPIHFNDKGHDLTATLIAGKIEQLQY